jgi:hypothetical protein
MELIAGNYWPVMEPLWFITSLAPLRCLGTSLCPTRTISIRATGDKRDLESIGVLDQLEMGFKTLGRV